VSRGGGSSSVSTHPNARNDRGAKVLRSKARARLPPGIWVLDHCWADPLFLSTSIEGEYVPVEGDEVTYKMCPIPPKNQKFQAVEVVLTQLAPHTPHETWSGQVVGS
jgi:hypothetical protein